MVAAMSGCSRAWKERSPSRLYIPASPLKFLKIRRASSNRTVSSTLAMHFLLTDRSADVAYRERDHETLALEGLPGELGHCLHDLVDRVELRARVPLPVRGDGEQVPLRHSYSYLTTSSKEPNFSMVFLASSARPSK